MSGRRRDALIVLGWGVRAALIVGVATATTRIGRMGTVGGTLAFSLQNLVFVLGSAVLLCRSVPTSLMRAARDGSATLVSAAAGCVILMMALPAGLDVRGRIPELSAVLLAAAAEELVFRRWLPTSLYRMQDRGPSSVRWLFASVVSQAAFALSHQSLLWQQPATMFAASASRLVLLGVLLNVVVQRAGLAAAIAIHAAFNIQSQEAGNAGFFMPDPAAVAVAGAFALAALAHAGERSVLPRTRLQEPI